MGDRAEVHPDTARLDWLEAHSAYFGSAIEMDHGAWLDYDADSLRAAIDEAMRASQPPTPDQEG